jgi:hypothetical protein
MAAVVGPKVEVGAGAGADADAEEAGVTTRGARGTVGVICGGGVR